MCRGKGSKSYIGHWVLSEDINGSEEKQIIIRYSRSGPISREQMKGCSRSTSSLDLMNMVQSM